MAAILITGAGGFLGSHLLEYFKGSGVGLTQSLNAPDRIRTTDYSVDHLCRLFVELQPAAIIHAAGGASVPASVADPQADFAAGPALLVKLLEAARISSPATKFVFLSSAAVYGNPSLLPVKESEPLRPISPYGEHKAESEALCREYLSLHAIPCATLRIFSAYGTGLKRQVIWDLCKKLASGDKAIPLQGTGAESRDFIHARDVAEAVGLILKKGNFEGACYNLASGRETTIRDLATRLRDQISPACELNFDGVVPVGNPTRWCADITALQELGFSAGVALEVGLREYTQWFSAKVSANHQ